MARTNASRMLSCSRSVSSGLAVAGRSGLPELCARGRALHCRRIRGRHAESCQCTHDVAEVFGRLVAIQVDVLQPRERIAQRDRHVHRLELELELTGLEPGRIDEVGEHLAHPLEHRLAPWAPLVGLRDDDAQEGGHPRVGSQGVPGHKQDPGEDLDGDGRWMAGGYWDVTVGCEGEEDLNCDGRITREIDRDRGRSSITESEFCLLLRVRFGFAIPRHAMV